MKYEDWKSIVILLLVSAWLLGTVVSVMEDGRLDKELKQEASYGLDR